MASESKKSFRQVCDKPSANRIVQAEWSPVRDLIAIVTSNGDVRLHRMYWWQKVWVITAKESHATCLAWKCNGKILAVGHDNGIVSLIEITKASTIHTFDCKAKITSLRWSSQKKESEMISYKDYSKPYLPEIEKEDLLKAFERSKFLIPEADNYSVLTVGNNTGEVYLFIEGMFPVLEVHNDNYPVKYRSNCVVSTHLSLANGVISVICKGSAENDEKSGDCFYLYQFCSQLLGSRGAELSYLSVKFIKVTNLVGLCEKVLKQMSDASEDVYLKINSKLEKLENLLAPGSSVAAEFTIAYATGQASAEMQTFLTQHLTTKGLKQIDQTVQSAYTSLHCDMKDELELLTQHLMFEFVELQGMAKWFEKFGIVGLSLESVNNSNTLLIQFIMKIQEFLKVVCDDMNNFRIFFAWLTNLVFQVSDEPNPIQFKQFSNDNYDAMLRFLEYRLRKVKKGDSYGYDLERVSQFFKDGLLDFNENVGSNSWYDYVDSNDLLKNSPLIVKPDTEATLQELFNRFKNSFYLTYHSITTNMSDSLSSLLSTKLFRQAEEHGEECTSLFSFLEKENRLLLSVLACSCDSDKMFLLDMLSSTEIKTFGVALEMNKDDSLNSSQLDKYQLTLRDAKFYNQDFMTILFEEEEKTEERMVTVLAQLPFHEISSGPFLMLNPELDEEGMLDRQLDINWNNILHKFSEKRRMDAFRGKYLSLNGYTREVCSIVALSTRRIRIFDMTAEDDEAEEESKLEDRSKIDDADDDDIDEDRLKTENNTMDE